MKTLLVDDDSSLRRLLARILTERGYEVHGCESAEQAWDACESLTFDMAIIDWMLPGMSGLELCRRLRARSLPQRPLIIMLTGRSGPDDLAQVLEAGADDYWTKPIEIDRLRVRLTVAERQARNIGERARAENALRESVERFELAVRGTNDGIYDGDLAADDWFAPDSPFFYSARFKALLGYGEAEFPNVRRSWIEHLHPDDRPQVIEGLRRHLEQGGEYENEYRLRTKSGEYRWFSTRGHALWDKQGRPIRFSGAIRDITARRRTEDALRDSEEKWRSLVKNIPDFVTTADLDGNILFINRTLEGTVAEDVVGKNLLDFAPPADRSRMRETLERVIRQAVPEQVEVAAINLDGSTSWLSSRIGPIIVAGRVVEVIVVSSDIGDRKRMEEALQNERRLLRQLLDVHERERQLVAYEIHDSVISKLTGSLMHLDASGAAAERDPRLSATEFEQGTKLLRNAVADARRLLSGLRPPILDEFGVIAAIEYLVNEMRPSVAQVEFDHDVVFRRLAPPLESAIFRIVQEALTNLGRHSQASTARISLSGRAGQLRLEIADNGIGFEPQKSTPGSFGLQGIRERARLLGGSAKIDSAPGQGTRVTVEFPLPAGDEEWS
jgi:PAS domain S-box-containing protein